MTVVEVHFEEKPDSDKPEALRMEHFYLPLGILFVGLVLSAIFFLAEIIKHRMTKVSMATQEGSRVSQSSAESEVEHKTDVEEIEDKA